MSLSQNNMSKKMEALILDDTTRIGECIRCPAGEILRRFCEIDGWELYKDSDYYFCKNVDENGNIRLYD